MTTLTAVRASPGLVAATMSIAGIGALAALFVTASLGTSLLVGAALAAVVACCVRPELAVLAVVASFPLLWPGDGQPALLNQLPKALGALAIGTYGLRAIWRGTIPRWDSTYAPILGLIAAYVLASTMALDLSLALDATSRLVMFALFYVVLTQDDLNDDPGQRSARVMWTFVLATTLAVVIALPPMLTRSIYQLTLPNADPNDFGAIVATALVLAVGLIGRSGAQKVAVACAIILAGGLLLTLSRGSLLAAAVGLAWMALADGTLRRLLVRGAAVGAALLVPVFIAMSGLLIESLGRKANVAGSNVDSRMQAWTIAADLGLQNPLAGIGPGNLGVVMRDLTQTPADAYAVAVAHNTYLDLWVDAAVPAAVCFSALLFVVVRRLVRIARDSGRRHRPVAITVQAAAATMLVAAAFSTQLFNGALWVVIALPLLVRWSMRSPKPEWEVAT